jgi:hypothetical protein
MRLEKAQEPRTVTSKKQELTEDFVPVHLFLEKTAIKIEGYE